MQKLFRKYSRTLLLVFMSILLVVFLVGDSIGRGVRGQGDFDPPIGELDGKTVYTSQAHAALVDFDVAHGLGFNVPLPNVPNEHERAILAMLLLHEADKYGVKYSADSVEQALHNHQGAAVAIENMRRATNRSLSSIYESVGRVMATAALFTYQLEAIGESQPRLEHSYQQQTQEAEVRLSVIDANALVAATTTPTDEEIKANFEEGKNRTDEHTSKELKFGYRVPDRVQVEYLTVDPVELQSVVRVKEREAKRYFEQNKDKYRRPAAGPSPFDLDPAKQQQTPEMITPEFEEVKEKVKEDYRVVEAIETAQRRVNEIEAEARRPWDSVPMGADGKRSAPPADAIQSFESLRDRFSSDMTVTYHRTELVDVFALRREPGFGRASVMINRRPTPATTLAFRVAPLNPTPSEELPTLQINEPGPVVFESRPGPNGQLAPQQAFVFRVIQAIPSGPPASVDEVRDKVVENIRAARAFALAGEQAEKLAARAREVGLDEAVAQDEGLRKLLGADSSATSQPATVEAALKKLTPTSPEKFRRQAGYIQNVGFSTELNEAVFKLADQSDSAAHKVVAVPIATTRQWVVAELIRVKPIYRGEFDSQRDQLERQAAYPSQQQFAVGWLDPENIIRRTGFKARETIGKSEEEAEKKPQGS